jgi:hypothetical protein
MIESIEALLVLRLTPSNAKLSMPGANISCHD